MIVCFKLSMPNRGSWNGRWSGEADVYARVFYVGTAKKTIEKYKKIIEEGSYYYNFGDGWGASISVEEITGAEAKKIKKITHGFCGYDWMIDSIIKNGDIIYDK